MKRLLRNLAKDTCHDDGVGGFVKVEMKSRFSEMTFNTIMRMVSGEIGDVEEARKFRGLIKEMVRLGGANNFGDFVPIVRWFDLDGLEKKLKNYRKKVDDFLQGLIDEHRNNHIGSQIGDTMIDHLLTMQHSQPEYYTDQIIKGLIVVSVTFFLFFSFLFVKLGPIKLINYKLLFILV